MTHESPSAVVRDGFPPVFWVANGIELLERFAYYGIYLTLGIYLDQLGFSKGQLGWVQSLVLAVSYMVPIVSGTLADRLGFKRVLIVSYLSYLPAILMMIVAESFSAIALAMLTIALAAGIFKPLISGTIRAVTSGNNKTLGFGIFYAMVNVGGSLGPIVAGKLRVLGWQHVFTAAAIAVAAMLVITILYYEEPPRERSDATLLGKLKEIGEVLVDLKFTAFLTLLGLLFWLPFWCFFNLCALYVDSDLDTARLYVQFESLFGPGVAGFFAHRDDAGVMRILGETVSHTGWVIMVFQVGVSRVIERFRAIPVFLGGLTLVSAGFVLLALAKTVDPALLFAGIAVFAIGEMVAAPRIQEYITWLAPKEKAGLYMGSNFLAVGLGGALSGVTYTSWYGGLGETGHPEHVWLYLASHVALAIPVFVLFGRLAGEFAERDA
ncbi:MAG: MFS transporter [Myxococcales bacterium FL481]|nr:MAG: MFS transporter [Myxococcales bacterium FL481]